MRMRGRYALGGLGNTLAQSVQQQMQEAAAHAFSEEGQAEYLARPSGSVQYKNMEIRWHTPSEGGSALDSVFNDQLPAKSSGPSSWSSSTEKFYYIPAIDRAQSPLPSYRDHKVTKYPSLAKAKAAVDKYLAQQAAAKRQHDRNRGTKQYKGHTINWSSTGRSLPRYSVPSLQSTGEAARSPFSSLQEAEAYIDKHIAAQKKNGGNKKPEPETDEPASDEPPEPETDEPDGDEPPEETNEVTPLPGEEEASKGNKNLLLLGGGALALFLMTKMGN